MATITTGHLVIAPMLRLVDVDDGGHGGFSIHPDSCSGCAAADDLLHTDQEFVTCAKAEHGMDLVVGGPVDPDDDGIDWHLETLAAAGYPDPCEREWEAEGTEL